MRHVRAFDSRSDIVMIDFVNPQILALAQAGKTAINAEQYVSATVTIPNSTKCLPDPDVPG